MNENFRADWRRMETELDKIIIDPSADRTTAAVLAKLELLHTLRALGIAHPLLDPSREERERLLFLETTTDD